ncbi:flavin reductase family protein [Orrella marina]|uniref:Flavin reductase n=1 Tax=Orrella marina TaxID=2163011 RepID=A0A2R4XIU9_9BURK|nr:flavin reductase family protein [Orrella marina]AWB33654.1 flavin reductase [Orrella marina]
MSARSPDFTSIAFRQALGRFPTGVTVVTACMPGEDPVGLTVSSFNSVSLDPPLVFWSLSLGSSSKSVFERCERYIIHVLSAEQFDIASRFASGTREQRFEGVPLVRTAGGQLRLDLECAAWFECYNRHRFVEGDHLMLLGEVEHCEHSPALPLIYHAGGYDLTPARQ